MEEWHERNFWVNINIKTTPTIKTTITMTKERAVYELYIDMKHH